MAYTDATLAGTLAHQLDQQPSRMSRAWKFLRWFAVHKPLGFVSGIATVVIITVALLAWAGWIIPYDPIAISGVDRLKGFLSTSARDADKVYVFGTDELGRDVFSRLIKGAQISVFFSWGVVLVAVPAGAAIGLMSAYIGGRFDLLVQRVIDVIQVLPFLVLAIAIVSILGPGLVQGFTAVAVLAIDRPARLVRGAAMSAKENVWVEAARTIGASDKRIMFRHILPNIVAPLIVFTTFLLAVAVLSEASLSFLGIGAQPPTPSWGAMLSGAGRRYFETHPRLALLPGIAISVMVFSTNMFGDALRDVLDPRLRGR
jgi:peptide/nickel transport system permease protein